MTIGPTHKYQTEPYDRAKEARKVCAYNYTIQMVTLKLVNPRIYIGNQIFENQTVLVDDNYI